MKHISKKIAAIEEPLEISHYVHDEIEDGCNTSSSDSSYRRTMQQMEWKEREKKIK
jgi:hypothetical protein